MPENSPLQHALEIYQSGEVQLALESMQKLVLAEPENPQVRIEFANILMREKRFNDARDALESLPADDKKNLTALALLSQLDAIETVINAPDFDDLIESLEQAPKNCLAREQLCAHYILRGDYPSAMEQLLNVVRCDRKYNNDAGRTGLLAIFDTLGHDHELAIQYRRKLAQLLN